MELDIHNGALQLMCAFTLGREEQNVALFAQITGDTPEAEIRDLVSKCAFSYYVETRSERSIRIARAVGQMVRDDTTIHAARHALVELGDMPGVPRQSFADRMLAELRQTAWQWTGDATIVDAVEIVIRRGLTDPPK